MIIHPNGSDPHSHAACPIFVISRWMRLEVITYLLTDPTSITLNATSSYLPNQKFDFLKNTRGLQLRETNSSATKRKYVWRDQLTRSFEYTLSDIRPYTFVLGLNETEGTISINRKALALYSVFNIFSILDSQRLCQYGVVLRIIIQPVSPY